MPKVEKSPSSPHFARLTAIALRLTEIAKTGAISHLLGNIDLYFNAVIQQSMVVVPAKFYNYD